MTYTPIPDSYEEQVAWEEAQQRQLSNSRIQSQVQSDGSSRDDRKFSELICDLLSSYRNQDEDSVMDLRASLKGRFRLSDDQINHHLFKALASSKLKPVRRRHDSVDLTKVVELSYLLDGWLPKGDVSLVYAEKGTGKTCLGLALCMALAQGESFLDRSKHVEPAKSIFIATDSGIGPLKRAMHHLGILPEDPIFKPDHEDQMILIEGHASEQGHASWCCDIKGVVWLERQIRSHSLKLVVIDSAKSVSSNAGWSYTSNESTKAILTYMRECICEPLGCTILFLSHDGTAKGSHSGAKAWAEEPSMVISLSKELDQDGNQKGVVAQFIKDRAAPPSSSQRKVPYRLSPDTGAFELAPGVEKVGCCEDIIVEIMWDAYQRDVPVVSRKGLVDEALAAYQRSAKTVDNTLGALVKDRAIVRKGKGRYALAPATLQRLQSSNRDPYIEGRNKEKTQSVTGVCSLPGTLPDVQNGNNELPTGNSPGNNQIPVHNSDLSEILPAEHGCTKQPGQSADDFVF